MNNEADVLKALQHLEQRLTAAFNAGIAELQAALSELQTQHNKAMLDQERRNSTFANRDRLEAVASKLYDKVNHQLVLENRLHRVERDVGDLQRAVGESDHDQASGTIASLKSQLGYFLTGALVIGGTILGFILNHLGK